MSPAALTAARMGARELRRTPVLLALLVVLPAYVVGLFTSVAPEATVVVQVAGGESVRTGLATAFPAVTTPMAAALLTGVVGLFVMHAGAAADGRLVLAGFAPAQVVAARLLLLAGVGGVATAVSVAVMGLTVTPAHLGLFVLGVWLTAAVYGLVGVLAGVVLDRLPGVYVLLFGAMVDLFLFQNPLATDPPDAAVLLPGYYPLALAMDAAFGESVGLGPLWGSLAVLAVVGALAVGAVYRGFKT
ncbi:MAG: hypothetical protein ABEJ42_01485 [Halobacteriaceae archaeon]